MCPDPELCKRLGRHIHGRLWEIWNGVNISPEKAARYRAMWENGPTDDIVKVINFKRKECNCGKRKQNLSDQSKEPNR